MERVFPRSRRQQRTAPPADAGGSSQHEPVETLIESSPPVSFRLNFPGNWLFAKHRSVVCAAINYRTEAAATRPKSAAKPLTAANEIKIAECIPAGHQMGLSARRMAQRPGEAI